MSLSMPGIRSILYANAAFSFISAILITFFPEVLAEYVINLPAVGFRLLGIGLGLFALGVLMTARQPLPARGRILCIFVADISWVTLTPVVILLLQQRLTGPGNLLLLMIAVVVLIFAVLEWLALRRQNS